MSKNTEINLVGQPIFKQIINLLVVINITGIVKRHEADLYYKTYPANLFIK